MTIDTARPWLASYAPGVPHDIEPVTGSLLDIVEGTAAEYPKSVALEFFGATTTYAELVDQISRAAEGLRKLGVRHGDTVALVLPNSPQHVVAFYAVLRLGAIVVEHNPLYTPRELRHQFEDHGAKIAIAWDKVVETLQDFPSDVAVDSIVSIDVTRGMPLATRTALRLPIKKARESRDRLTTTVRGTVPWEKIVGSSRIKARHPRPETTDLAVIQYTSGTTGTPKGAQLTHANLLSNAAQSRAWVPTITRGECTVYAVLPMFHAYGLTLCLTFAMSMGARLVLFPAFDPALVLKVMKKRPPTFLPAVPPIYTRLRKAADDAGVSLKGVEVAISGAMPLSAEVVEPWEEQSGGWLVEGYGLSECSPVLMANPVGPTRRAGTVGLPLSSTEVRVVDPEDPTVDVPAGESGELIVRGPQVFSGYYRKPQESSEVFVDGDWFRTGDIVTIDPDGFVRVVDRIKELIITGGFNVSPSEVEEVLLRHEGVAEAAAVGLPSPGGEQVAAAIVLHPGAEVDVQALRAFARQHLTPYKVPRRIVVVDELPKSLIGKVLRRKVRDELADR
ncbi:long-chain fatty acid--CoA ligase [Frigoribacterium sp. ACAM 257]|uniref:long-chain-fatty-acid--CoA ligase n=1 Tax=Frigoribacterium sp. ACAM 257 TaxID=2508998 RepID=UPI0011BA08B0|nr:long-chain-fatty-acid--CoA ligase [Frigoribacterium sp. ACAM 257]TWX37239.1 long-chain fatty acid--CoA ligase [Frigoribacterium sp. ACAM 257]